MRIVGLGTTIGATALAGCIPGGPPPSPQPQPPQPPYERQTPERQTPERQTLDDDVVVPPAPPPAWDARRVTPDARMVAPSDYIVRPGDTLRAIAERTGAGSEAIARANRLQPPFTIQPGQRLSIPGGRYHLVRAGETGIAIARAYAVAWGNVVTANLLAAPYILRVGQRVLIPGGGAPPSSRPDRIAALRLSIDDIVTGSQPAIAENQRPSLPTTSAARPLPSVAQVAPPTAAPGRYLWPVNGSIVRRFGPGGTGERNDGIKIAAPIGTPVLAAADGVVAYAGSDVAAFGGLVMVSHGSGVTTVYGYASRLLVTRGQAVKRGETLALSGASGFADRPMLHFEIRQGRRPVDPLTRLPSR